MSSTGRMGIGLIGDDPAGPVVAHALGAAGHQLTGRSVPREDRIEQVEALMPGVPVLDVADIVRRSELVILAATGDALTALVEQFETGSLGQAGHIVAHLSPGHGVDVLAPCAARGLIPLRLFPMLPMTGTSLDVGRLKNAWCAVSAPGPVMPIAQALAIEMGMEPFIVESGQEEAFAEVVDSLTTKSMGFVKTAVDTLEGAGLDNVAPALSALATAAVEAALRERSTPSGLLGDAAGLLGNSGLDDD